MTVEGVVAPAVAECQFVGNAGVAVGIAEPFSTNVTPGNYASLAGLGTAVVTEPGPVLVICETSVEGTNFVIPAETGHLAATKVGALHSPTQ
jgi:hypothetical protein